MFRNQSGQIGTTWIIGIGATVVLAWAGSMLTQSNMFNSKVDVVKTDLGATNQRVATLEEAIKTIKDDNTIIKSDIKEILRRLK